TTCELLTKTQNQFADLIHFEVHPNPVSGDYLFIDYQLENTKKVRFLLQDINGKLLQSYKQNNIGQFQMNIQNLEAGVYILMLQTKKGQASKKFLVK
ncbi:MAG: T9SS type A sorting domain-containing protein, partial [Bacteroidota bacterium]